MFARMALPLLGGSPAVWNTAMVFYQAVLLAGYAYAHWTFQRLGVRRQAWLHLGILALPFLVFPVAVPDGWLPPTETNPLPWLILLLLFGVGLPFFAVATSSPVLQRWFSVTAHPSAHDPYFLYAASNLGSVLALLSYPFLLEPNLSLENQSRLWSWGYALAFALTATCALITLRRTGNPVPATAPMAEPESPEPPPAWSRRAHWLALAAVPCSLMLGVTTFITTDLASIPLLWVIPLALYLLSFILVFSQKQWFPPSLARRLLPLAAVAMILIFTSGATEPLPVIMLVSLAAFFIAAMACHGELAATRPAARHLTVFYLCLSLGGFLGGAFNALLAPFLFNSVAEYPLAFTLACLLGLAGATGLRTLSLRPADWLIPAALGLLAFSLFRAGDAWSQTRETETVLRGLLAGVPALLCFLCSRRPLRFALAVGAVLIAGHTASSDHGRVLHAERGFFGIHRITTDTEERFFRLVHGNTFHGKQSRDPERRGEALAYYHRTGPMGQVFESIESFPQNRIAMIGLGTGALAAYGRPGEHWRFYEIDPAVARIARDTRYFTYLEDSEADIEIILGDARIMLEQSPDRHYGLIVLDAYSSDAIPVHLLTRESLRLYRDKLTPDGLLAFHISNRHLNLPPLFAALADDAGWFHLFQDDIAVDPREATEGKMPSQWVIMAENESTLEPFRRDPRWQRLQPETPPRIWTDSYSSLFEVFRWRP